MAFISTCIWSFWADVMLLLQKVLGLSLPLDSVHYLLCLPFSDIAKPIKCWRMEFLTATVNDAVLQINKIWEIWNKPEYGDHYPDLMSPLTVLYSTDTSCYISGVYTFLMTPPLYMV